MHAGAVIAEKYELLDILGEGGMGAVWRARHRELGRVLAIKFVLGEIPTEAAIERFLREARACAKVRHRNVVDVVDFGRGADGLPYLAMECLEGESLDARLKRLPPATLAEISEWMMGALSGLGAIHDAGIVHRDLKPANIFLSRDADGVVPKVLDFGIARTAEGNASPLTHSMQTLGTPHYMSPEQVRSAKSVDARSDVYAMGVILYQALTGRLPFDGPSATAVIAAIVTDDPERVESLRPDVPRGVATVVHRAMAREPGKRFDSARELRDAFVRAAAGASIDSAPSIDLGASDTVLAESPFGHRTPSADASSRVGPKRTGRRAFFALFAALSMVLVGVIGAGNLAAPVRRAADAPQPAPAAAPVAIAPVPATGRVRVSAPASLDELAVQLRDLDRATLARVRMIPIGDAFAIAAENAIADELRARLGDRAAAGPDESSEPLTIAVLRTNVGANLRTAPDVESGELIATLGAGTVVVALHGTVDGRSSLPASPHRVPGTWARVVVAEGLDGWVASNLLTTETRCLPSLEASGGPRVEIANVLMTVDGDETRALALFERGGASRASTIRIAVPSGSCSALEDRTRLTLGPTDQISDFFFTRTAEHGATLLAVGTTPRGDLPLDGLTHWTVRALDAIETVLWERDLHSGENVPAARRDLIGGAFLAANGVEGFFPFRVREGQTRTFYVWENDALVPFVPPAPVEGTTPTPIDEADDEAAPAAAE